MITAKLSLIFTFLSVSTCKRVDYLSISQQVNQANSSWHACLAPEIDYNDDQNIAAMSSGSLDSSKFIDEVAQFPRKPRLLQKSITSMGFVSALNVSLRTNLQVPEFPENLDLRLKYPACPSISLIHDQSECASCWAFALAGTTSDAYCISKAKSGQPATRLFSPQDSLECCTTCFGVPEKPCAGGYMYQAFKYAKEQGLVSGDSNGQTHLCKPYFLPDNFKGPFSQPSCSRKCNDKSGVLSYEDDKIKITDFIYGKGVDQMVQALNTYGSIACSMDIYRDFLTYSDGIYIHLYGENLGGHAVKVIGYGVENGQPYWLAVNTWGKSWGQKGLFKIKKGSDESSIESRYFFVPIF